MKLPHLKLKWKLLSILSLLLVPTTLGGLAYTFETIYQLQVNTALSGLMNFVDSKQQGVIRFIGSTEKLALQLAILKNNADDDVVQKQFAAVIKTDIFDVNQHPFSHEIESRKRSIATWKSYHAIDFVRHNVIEISSDPARVGRRVDNSVDTLHGYSDVYMDGDVPIFTARAKTKGGMIYVHAHAGMLTIITNGEIGNLEGDMGAYYLAGVEQTFDFYITNRNNTLITQSRVHPNALLKQKGSEFPWRMTQQDPTLGIECLTDGTYLTNAGHYTGCREAMGFYLSSTGKQMLGASMPFYDSGWTIVVEQEANELLAPLFILRQQIGIGALFILTLTLLSGIVFIYYVTRPLRAIINDIKRLSNGDLSVKVHGQDRGDEIGDMAKVVKVFKDSLVKNATTDIEVHKLSQTVEQSPNMTFITDTNGIIEYANAKFYEITGFVPIEVLGQSPSILKSGNTPTEVYEDLWKTIKAEKIWRHEIEDRGKDGRLFWAHVMIAPIRSKEGKVTHFLAIHENISQRKEAERKMLEAKEQAEVANRAKTDLMANMSHELRTPLNAIIGFSGTIKEEIFGPVGHQKYAEYMDDIYNSGNHLLGLINDILDVSAIEAQAFELQDQELCPFELVESSIRLVSPRAISGHVKVTSVLPASLPKLHADERRVKQIMLNLLSNAVKFTPEDGEVTVHGKITDTGCLEIAVTDTGIGMNAQEIKTAMSKFGQVDSGLNRKHEGTGLGLPLTKGLMDLHGGSLQVISRKGSGTTVTATFPKDRVAL